MNPPADDPLVVTKLVLTIAAPYGPYGRCNVCVNGTDNHGDYNCTDNTCVVHVDDTNGLPTRPWSYSLCPPLAFDLVDWNVA